MIILAIRTDTVDTDIRLYEDHNLLASKSWTAGRDLARTLLGEITGLCAEAGTTIQAIEGVICYKGPGSFTGLRIGITVGNTIAYGNSVPIVGVHGDNWCNVGIDSLLSGANEKILVPEYGSEAHITL